MRTAPGSALSCVPWPASVRPSHSPGLQGRGVQAAAVPAGATSSPGGDKASAGFQENRPKGWGWGLKPVPGPRSQSSVPRAPEPASLTSPRRGTETCEGEKEQVCREAKAAK